MDIPQEKLMQNFLQEIENHKKNTVTPTVDQRAVNKAIHLEMKKLDKTLRKIEERDAFIERCTRYYTDKDCMAYPISILTPNKQGVCMERKPTGVFNISMVSENPNDIAKSAAGQAILDKLQKNEEILQKDMSTYTRLAMPGQSIFAEGFARLEQEREAQLKEDVRLANQWISQQKLDNEPSPEQVSLSYNQ